MSYPYYIVDAFAEEVSRGNSAAIYVLEKRLPGAITRNIAIENSLLETAFTVKEGQSYALRWPMSERKIDLYGHVTLATTFVLFNYYSVAEGALHFTSQSEPLAVTKKEEYYYLDFPYTLPKRISTLPKYEAALGTKTHEAYLGRDLFLVLKGEKTVAEVILDFSVLRALDLGTGAVVMASGDSVDFVSRALFSKLGVNEDLACGSAHANLIPRWEKWLSQTAFLTCQVSPRDGFLTCEVKENRVITGGIAKLLIKGETYLPT